MSKSGELTAADIDLLAEAELLARETGDIIEPTDAPPPPRVDPPPVNEGWYPDLNPTQRKIFDDPAENVLAHSEKGSGKTIIMGHRMVRHAYENDNALVLVITPMIRTGSQGIWHDLETLVLPAWRDGNRYPLLMPDGKTPNPKAGQLMDSGIGLEYTKSALDPLTKDRHRWIRTKNGGWSMMLLMSIPHASQVETRVAGPAPSMVYIDELDKCDGREYWAFTTAQLGRRRDISGPQQFLATCNPKGPSHWVYQVFFVECLLEDKKTRDPNFSVYHVPITENLHRLPPGYVERLKRSFGSDKVRFKRLITGDWIDEPTGEGLFRSFYSPQLHLMGDLARSFGLKPVPGFPIFIGYDIGTVWQAITFLQCVPTVQKNIWIIFDECDHLKEKITYKMLALEVVTKMRFWRREVGYRFAYNHITDESATTQWRPGQEAGGYDALEFEKEFNKVLLEFGKIGTDGNVEPARLLGCPKGPGSVEARVRTIQSKLAQQELAISAMCVNTVDCMNNLESDKENPSKPKRSPWIHKFDSLSYPIFKMDIGGDSRLYLPLARQSEAPRIIKMGSR